MRVLIIIITLFGGATFGYSFFGHACYLAGQSVLMDTIHTSPRWRVSVEQYQTMEVFIERLSELQQRDWQVIRYLGAAIFLLGLSALMLERRRYVSRNAV